MPNGCHSALLEVRISNTTGCKVNLFICAVTSRYPVTKSSFVTNPEISPCEEEIFDEEANTEALSAGMVIAAEAPFEVSDAFPRIDFHEPVLEVFERISVKDF